MQRTKSYRIPLQPIPWQRARLNDTRFFDGQIESKETVALFMQRYHGNDPLFSRPLHMDVQFFMKLPKSVKDRKDSPYHAAKPYIDNLCKFLIDTMRDVLITDDKLICSISAKKVYSRDPRTEFTLTELE